MKTDDDKLYIADIGNSLPLYLHDTDNIKWKYKTYKFGIAKKIGEYKCKNFHDEELFLYVYMGLYYSKMSRYYYELVKIREVMKDSDKEFAKKTRLTNDGMWVLDSFDINDEEGNLHNLLCDFYHENETKMKKKKDKQLIKKSELLTKEYNKKLKLLKVNYPVYKEWNGIML